MALISLGALMKLFLISLFIGFSAHTHAQSLPTEKYSLLTCDFSQMGKLGNVISEDQKNYEVNLALFNYMTDIFQAEQNHIFDQFGVHSQLLSVSKLIKISNTQFENSIREDINDLTCTCLYTREKEMFDKPEFKRQFEQLAQCRRTQRKPITNTSWQLPQEEVIKQTQSCPATNGSAVLASSGDPSTYMHSCFYCPAGTTYQNPFNNLSQVHVMSCESTWETYDTTREDKAKVIESLIAGDDSITAKRMLLVDIEKTYGFIQKKYQQRVQTIQNAFENVFRFAKDAYEKSPCVDCITYAATNDGKTIIVDPWNNGKPKWAMIGSSSTRYSDLNRRLGYIDLSDDHLRKIGHNEHLYSLFGYLNDSDRSILGKYLLEEHYKKPKTVTPKDPSKLTPYMSHFNFVDNFSLKDNGTAYPFEGMLTYIKTLFSSANRLNTIANGKVLENNKLVAKQMTALKDDVHFKLQTVSSVSMEMNYKTLIASLDAEEKQESEVASILKNLGISDDGQIKSDSKVLDDVLRPVMALSGPRSSLASFQTSPKAIAGVKTQVLRFKPAVSEKVLNIVNFRLNFALSNPSTRKLVGASDKTNARIKAYQKHSEELFSISKETLDKNSFKALYASEEKAVQKKGKTPQVFALFSMKVPAATDATPAPIVAPITPAKVVMAAPAVPVVEKRIPGSANAVSDKERYELAESALLINKSQKEAKKLEPVEDDSLFDRVNKAYKRNYNKLVP